MNPIAAGIHIIVADLYSGITGGKIEELKEVNKNCIDDVFSSSHDIKDMLNTAFQILRKKTR